jgi:hypothetical protein
LLRSRWQYTQPDRHHNRVRRIVEQPHLTLMFLVSCQRKRQVTILDNDSKTYMVGIAVAMLLSTHSATIRPFVKEYIVYFTETAQYLDRR